MTRTGRRSGVYRAMEYKTKQLHKVFFRFLDLRYKSEYSIRRVLECVDVEIDIRLEFQKRLRMAS